MFSVDTATLPVEKEIRWRCEHEPHFRFPLRPNLPEYDFQLARLQAQ